MRSTVPARGPSAPLLAAVNGAHDVPSLVAAIAVLETDGVDGGLPLSARPDTKDSAKMIAGISFGGLGLPGRDYYFNEGDRADKIRGAYHDYVAAQIDQPGRRSGQGRDRSDGRDRARDGAGKGDAQARRLARPAQGV